LGLWRFSSRGLELGKREEDEAGTCQGFFSFLFFGCVDGYSRVEY
jgi:hypothetical protein